jgi:glycosyltransferase involved in cell wall biosynthesis
LKVLQVIPSLSPAHGGPSVALPLIARSLIRAGLTVDVATTDDDGPGKRLDVPLGERTEHEGYGVFYFRKQTEFYKVSWPLRGWLRQRACDYDLVHIHALFSFSSTCAARAARRQGVPYVLRPLGVLNRWGMENRRPFLKSLSFRLIERPILRHAAAMHYTSDAERREAEAAGATAPAAIIPLGIDAEPFWLFLPSPEKFFEQFPQARGRPVVLFLSRLDPKKGLETLLEAWARLLESNRIKPDQTKSNLLLVIAGSGDPAYVKQLQENADALGLADQVLWTGFLDGADKRAAFAAATVYVLPSHSENFGIALVEALAAGLPCVTTTGVAVSEEVREHEAGLVITPDVPALTDALNRLLSDAALRARLGANARRLAQEKFSSESMGTALNSLYECILASPTSA